MSLDAEKIGKPIRKLRKLVKKISAEPSPEQVHDLRTNCRRLEAALQAMALDAKGNGSKLSKSLSILRKRAGKVRDMDVLTSFASQISHEGDEKECSVQLLEHLGAERSQSAAKLAHATRRHGPDVRKRLKRISREIERAIARSEKQNNVSAHVTASALQLVSQLPRPARLDRTNLHPYRIKVKELHNLLRMAENSGQEDFVQTLGQVKDAIGEWHDWNELLAITRELLAHANCQLLRELKTRAEDRYERALHSAQAMRKKFLGSPATKRSSRSTKAKPTDRVWSATAALAA